MVSKRILIVERDDTVRATIRDMLASQGHEVTAVQWPNAAFAPLARHAFDVVLIGRGDYLFQSTRVLSWVIRATYPDVAIVLMTGHGQHAEDVGPFDDVLPKPFTIAQLQHTIALVTSVHQDAPNIPA